MTAIVTATALRVSDTALSSIFAALTVVALLVFVFERELAVAAGEPLRRLARGLVAVICPLLVVFAVSALTRLSSLIRLPS
jgi:hypothetical protein